jgi:hypothetical protein
MASYRIYWVRENSLATIVEIRSGGGLRPFEVKHNVILLITVN